MLYMNYTCSTISLRSPTIMRFSLQNSYFFLDFTTVLKILHKKSKTHNTLEFKLSDTTSMKSTCFLRGMWKSEEYKKIQIFSNLQIAL